MVLAYFAVLIGAALVALGSGLAFAGVVRAAPGSRSAPGVRAAPGSRATARHRPRQLAGLDDYGLLRAVALVANPDTGRSVRDLLSSEGVRATIATGRDGLTRVLVFPQQYDEARRLVTGVL